MGVHVPKFPQVRKRSQHNFTKPGYAPIYINAEKFQSLRTNVRIHVIIYQLILRLF